MEEVRLMNILLDVNDRPQMDRVGSPESRTMSSFENVAGVGDSGL